MRFNHPGFALIATISVMVLLVMVALAMLSLSTIELRASRHSDVMAEAQANARMALMIAIGELQQEMGPDQRISAEAAIFDTNEDTPEINGVNQSRWLASYNAWGGWLNGSYTVPNLDGSPGSTLKIADTYKKQREPMFRRWLVSLPEAMKTDIDAPVNGAGLNDDNSTVIVGQGTLGKRSGIPTDQITRAHLIPVGKSGSMAWWIGPENHKAKASLAKAERTMSPAEWESAQGGSADVAVDEIDGMDGLNADKESGDKLISQGSIVLGGADETIAKEHFFDVTTHGMGLMTTPRLGGLKLDLSLLFELPSNKLPSRFAFSSSSAREPSIRPMSSELQAKAPKIPGRHFASWTNMRHYYRMYKASSDATASTTGGAGSLLWQGSKPATGTATDTTSGTWDGSNHYQRMPIMAKLTFIYSLQSVPVAGSSPQKYNCYLVYTPVYTFWNPYNVELRLPTNKLASLTLPYKILPLNYYGYLNNSQQGGIKPVLQSLKQDYGSVFSSGGSGDIIFKPGELRIFSYRSTGTSTQKQSVFYPGFDPMAIGGDKLRLFSNVTSGQKPGIVLTFGNPPGQGGNVWFGNTPGGLNCALAWETASNGSWLKTMYQHDWLRPSEKDTNITPPGSSNVAYWQFGDAEPTPFAFNNFTLKTSSEFDYESIGWEKDWRCKNWMQAPSYYFGSAQYISSDVDIANTQRLDNPFTFQFGPMSSADMPKVVPHIGNSALLGSGSSPREQVTAAPMLELPSAPFSSLAAFSNMRLNPGWTNTNQFPSSQSGPWNSHKRFEMKSLTYQSGVTGPAIGNSFLHPMVPGEDVYRYFDNSKSHDVNGWGGTITVRDNLIYNDYWDHTLLANDALWDDYFISTLTDPSRPSAGSGASLSKSVDEFLSDGKAPSYSRYRLYKGKKTTTDIKSELLAEDGYLKAAQFFMVDGMFNINSTSVDAWFALFAGIRERQLVYHNGSSLAEADVPSGKLIALSRFNTPTTNKEADDAETGVTRADGATAWSGVRYLSDSQLSQLAEECVKQVKSRGPFLNLSEFINRRLSDDELGLRGALQSAIDYDDASPDSKSINYRYKSSGDNMIAASDIPSNQYASPNAAAGSRFTGIPGYIIQSDLLKPISNALSVRDDTFRIRTYGESKDAKGNVIARAWCEAIVQRVPEYVDTTNSPDVAARIMDDQGKFTDNPNFTALNKKWGRKLIVTSFRWLNKDEI